MFVQRAAGVPTALSPATAGTELPALQMKAPASAPQDTGAPPAREVSTARPRRRLASTSPHLLHRPLCDLYVAVVVMRLILPLQFALRATSATAAARRVRSASTVTGRVTTSQDSVIASRASGGRCATRVSSSAPFRSFRNSEECLVRTALLTPS